MLTSPALRISDAGREKNPPQNAALVDAEKTLTHRWIPRLWVRVKTEELLKAEKKNKEKKNINEFMHTNAKFI